MAVLRAEAATTVEEIPSARRVHQAVVASGSIARLDGAGVASEDAGGLGAAVGLAGARVARRRTAGGAGGRDSPGAALAEAGLFGGEGAVLGAAFVVVPRALGIVVAADRVRVGALLAEAGDLVLDVAGRILRAFLEVGVSPWAALLAGGSTVEDADGREFSAGRLGGDGVALLVAGARLGLADPEARVDAVDLFRDELAVGDALLGASEPLAAIVLFSLAGSLGGEVPAGSFASLGGGVPGATVGGRLIFADVLVGGGASARTAGSVVVVPLAVLVSSAGLDVGAIGFRAGARASASSPQADVAGALAGGGVGLAGRGADGHGAGRVPHTLGVGVTVGHGVVLVLARSGAALGGGVVDAGLRAVGLEVLARGFVAGEGFAVLAAHHGLTSPHAGGVSETSFLGGVLARAGGFAGAGVLVDLAAGGGRAGGVVSDLLARFNAGLGAIGAVNELAVLVVSALLDVGSGVLAVAADLAVAGGPSAERVGEALGLGAGLGTGGNADLVVGVPFAVVVGLAELLRGAGVEDAARIGAGAFEGPVALGGLAVLLDSVHLALLLALEVGVVVLAPLSATGLAVILGETTGADLGDTGLVGAVPLAFAVEVAGDVVGPLARSVDALADGGVPVAALVGGAGSLVGGEAESGAARASLGEPLALRVVVARFTDAVAEGAGGHAGAVGFNLAFAVLLAVGSGEDLAGAAAGLELADPLAVGVRGTSGSFSDGTAGTRALAALVVPEAVGVGFASSGGGVGNGAGGLAGVVDLHALAVRRAAGGVTRELVAGSSAGASGGVPLAFGVTLAGGGAVLVGVGADGRASSSAVLGAGRKFIAASGVGSRAVADAVAFVVESAALGGVARGEGGAGGGAAGSSRQSCVELAFGVASARVGAGGDDLRAVGEAAQALSVPGAAGVGGAAVLGRMRDSALHDALAGGCDFADGGGFAGLGGGDGVAGGAAGGSLAVPQALRISGTTDLGGVAQLARGCATSSLVVELTETRSNAGAVGVVGVAGRGALLGGDVPLAGLLSEAVAFGGELSARLLARLGGVVEAAGGVSSTGGGGGGGGSGVLDRAQGRAGEVLLVPSADKALSFALSLSLDEVAVLDALHGLGVPDALAVVAAGGFVGVLERAAGQALGVNPVADGVGAAGVDGGSLGAGALAGLGVGVPGALGVGVAVGLLEVASAAAGDALVDGVLAQGVAVAFDGVLVHGGAGFSAALGDGVELASGGGGAGFRGLGEVAAEHLALVVGVDAAHAEIDTALRGLGVVGVDHDLVAGSLADVLVVIPHAAGVVLAVALGGVDEGAFSLASHLGAVPDAAGVESAALGIGDLRADLRALAAVPLALGIGLAVVFRSASGAGDGARSGDGLLAVDAGVAVANELALSLAAVAGVGPLASGGFLALGLVGGRRAVRAALARDDVPLAFAVDVAVAVEGVGVLELAAGLAGAGGGVVLAEGLVAALVGVERGAVGLADGELGGRPSDPRAAFGGLGGTVTGLVELAAALGALSADEHAVGLGSAGGDVVDGTAEFSAGVADEVAVDVTRAVGLAGVAAALDA